MKKQEIRPINMYCKQCGTNFGHLSSCDQYNKPYDPTKYCEAKDYHNPEVNERIITSEEHLAWLADQWNWIQNYRLKK